MEIKLYSKECQNQWDDFVKNARNSHFMFYRNYMEYHADRFQDYSLMFFHKNKLVALLPANIHNNILYSHQGLSFGAIIVNNNLKTTVFQIIMQSLYSFLQKHHIKAFYYKSMPSFYHTFSMEADVYFLFNMGAQQVRVDLNSVVDYSQPLRISDGIKKNIKKAHRNNVTICENGNAEDFYPIWEHTLNKYHIKPIHSLAEINLLCNYFPKNLQFYTAHDEAGNVVSSAWLFITSNVVHMQCLARTETGNDLQASTLLAYHIIQAFKDSKRYFSWGISTENNGKILNDNLLDFKEGFGARPKIHTFYKLDIED